jgi:BMFP domain-containing protein YqiC
MIDRNLLDELGKRIADAVRDAPAQDLEKNLRALLSAFFDRFDLVAREDFDVQKKILERAQAKLEILETRVAELESGRGKSPTG